MSTSDFTSGMLSTSFTSEACRTSNNHSSLSMPRETSGSTSESLRPLDSPMLARKPAMPTELWMVLAVDAPTEQSAVCLGTTDSISIVVWAPVADISFPVHGYFPTTAYAHAKRDHEIAHDRDL